MPERRERGEETEYEITYEATYRYYDCITASSPEEARRLAEEDVSIIDCSFIDMYVNRDSVKVVAVGPA